MFRPGVLIGWAVLSLFALEFTAGPALAQLTPEQERTTDPGIQERQFEPALTPKAVPAPIIVPEIPRPTAPPGPSGSASCSKRFSSKETRCFRRNS